MTLPAQLNASILPQMKTLENVVEQIFDRNSCLLPAYFIVNELQKAYPDGRNWPHWVNKKYLLFNRMYIILVKSDLSYSSASIFIYVSCIFLKMLLIKIKFYIFI